MTVVKSIPAATQRQMLAQRMAMPFEDKLQLTKRRIIDWYKHWDGEVFVGFSGGLDSTVLLHIARSIYPDMPAVFSDTGLEMPEIRRFVGTFENVIRVRPKKSFDKVIREDGFALVSKKVSRQIRTLKAGPTGNGDTYKLYNEGITSDGHSAPTWKLADKWRHLISADIKTSEKCCDHLKKEPLSTYQKETGRKPYSGMMASEGGYRGSIPQCNAYGSKKPMSSPMLFWTEDDVWEYVRRFNVDICEVYYDRLVQDGETIMTAKDTQFDNFISSLSVDKELDSIVVYENGMVFVPAEKRTGCMFCMFGAHLEKGANRFQRMYYTHPRHWDTCINKLGLRKPLDLINVKYIPS